MTKRPTHLNKWSSNPEQVDCRWQCKLVTFAIIASQKSADCCSEVNTRLIGRCTGERKVERRTLPPWQPDFLSAVVACGCFHPLSDALPALTWKTHAGQGSYHNNILPLCYCVRGGGPLPQGHSLFCQGADNTLRVRHSPSPAGRSNWCCGSDLNRKKAALPCYNATGQMENLRNDFDLSNRFIVHCSQSLPVHILPLLLGLFRDF